MSLRQSSAGEKLSSAIQIGKLEMLQFMMDSIQRLRGGGKTFGVHERLFRVSNYRFRCVRSQ